MMMVAQRMDKLVVVLSIVLGCNLSLMELFGKDVQGRGLDFISLSIRIFVYIYAGWKSYGELTRSVMRVCFLGVALFFIEHVIFKGGSFLFEGVIGGSDLGFSISAFQGVLITFVIFSPVVVVLSLVGVLLKKWGQGWR